MIVPQILDDYFDRPLSEFSNFKQDSDVKDNNWVLWLSLVLFIILLFALGGIGYNRSHKLCSSYEQTTRKKASSDNWHENYRRVRPQPMGGAHYQGTLDGNIYKLPFGGNPVGSPPSLTGKFENEGQVEEIVIKDIENYNDVENNTVSQVPPAPSAPVPVPVPVVPRHVSRKVTGPPEDPYILSAIVELSDTPESPVVVQYINS